MNKVAANVAIDAVLLDDEKSQLAIYGRALSEILAEIDPNVQVEQIEIRSNEGLDEQVARFEADFVKRRPHILFVDNKHQSSDETDGQRLIERLKPRLPDTIFCLLTRQALRSSSFGIFNPNPDLILSKVYLTMGEPNEYRPYVRELIRERLKRSSRFSIEWVEPFETVFAHLKDAKGKKVTLPEVRSVLEQVPCSTARPRGRRKLFASLPSRVDAAAPSCSDAVSSGGCATRSPASSRFRRPRKPRRRSPTTTSRSSGCCRTPGGST